MSAKRGRRAKTQEPETQEGPAMEDIDPPNLSAIERASFMEGLQQNFGNPLHSTAMEEDLNVLESQMKDEGKTGGNHPPKASKTSVKQNGDTMKRKNTEREVEEQKKKRSRRSTVETVKAGPEKAAETKKKKGAPQGQREKLNTNKEDLDEGSSGPQQVTEASDVNQVVTKKPVDRKSSVQTSAAGGGPIRKIKKTLVKKDKNKLGSGKPDNSEPQEESDADAVPQRQRRVLSSDEDVTDDDTSWTPSQKETQRNSLDRNRKSLFKSAKSGTPSSDSTPENPDEDDTEKQRSKKPGSRSTTELEVVLDTFTEFCDQYRESVESKAVKQSIKSFSAGVKQQLMEKISSQKELKILKRRNAKVGSLIRKKTQRLLDAKHEMMRADRQVMSLRKENSELKHRLSDLRRGQTLLHDLRELNRLYLDYRKKQPKKKEMYGASSLPALQLENKHIKAAECKLKRKSNQLSSRQKMSRAKK
ncbi:uncharacterized protein cenpu [Halichoeres trimaculatus]|uniref:uncharacterized protein cenpu n=1 Tax=Halichoeres trimaculatus TaxID=147232 RepID=UPI003D9E207A